MTSLLELANRLPTTEEKNIKRISHVLEHGHLVEMKDGNKLVGYAEVYRLKDIPKFPVVPWPKDDPDGEYLYCWAASCERGRIKELIQIGKRRFRLCRWICYHRHKRNNKLHIERNEYYGTL
jgi:hypothetical protein